MKPIVVWESWKPDWAGHVRAKYTPVVYDARGMVDEPGHVECACDNCGATWKQECSSGAMRAHIQTFCKVHRTCKK